jgi:hypothetical protein
MIATMAKFEVFLDKNGKIVKDSSDLDINYIDEQRH